MNAADMQGVEQLTVVMCEGRWGCDGFEAWVMVHGVSYAILLAGALLATRWRDIPFVAFVAILGAALGSGWVTYLKDNTVGLGRYDPYYNWVLGIEYLKLLLWAAIAYALAENLFRHSGKPGGP